MEYLKIQAKQNSTTDTKAEVVVHLVRVVAVPGQNIAPVGVAGPAAAATHATAPVHSTCPLIYITRHIIHLIAIGLVMINRACVGITGKPERVAVIF